MNYIQTIEIQQLLEVLKNHFIISKTDPRGRITYANDYFCEISEYTREELIGKPHNIVRHSDMPKSVFKELWHTIKDKKEPWTGIVKNKKKNGGYYWVLATVFPILDKDGEVLEYISIRKEITSLMDSIEQEKLHSILFSIIQRDFYTKDLNDVLLNALLEILKHPVFELKNKGGIMLWNDLKKRLELTVYYNVSESLQKMCKEIKLGQCLCGLTALRKEIIFKSFVDEDHHHIPDESEPHGHYNIPLIFNDILYGVLFLYIPENEQKREILIQYLNHIGQMLGAIIYRYKMEEKLKRLNEELKNNNRKLVSLMERDVQITALISQFAPRSLMEYVWEAINIGNTEIPFKRKKYYYFLYFSLVDLSSFYQNYSPELIIDTINSIFDPIIDIIYNNEGDIDKISRGGIFAFFNNVENAIKVASEVRKIIKNFENSSFQIKFKIVIHSGFSIQGIIGNLKRREFSLIGDEVDFIYKIIPIVPENHILISEVVKNDYEKLNSSQIFMFSNKFFLKIKNKENLIPIYYLK